MDFNTRKEPAPDLTSGGLFLTYRSKNKYPVKRIFIPDISLPLRPTDVDRFVIACNHRKKC
jgi:hypothetical protein